MSTDDLDLEHFAMLSGVSAAARRELMTTSTRRSLAAGELLITQGEATGAMYFVVVGELGVSLGDPTAEPIALIGQGETVGELSVLDGSVASAHVVARTPCELLALAEEGFWALTHHSHAFSINLLVKLAERLRANNATVSNNIAKRRLYERAAMFDGLTGIHNRRWLDDTLHRLVERHERAPRGADGSGALSLALIDIDHFKSFNDGHGHDAGDAVLSIVAATMAANLRPTDLVARFGGEEFVILFPDTDLAAAGAAANRVRTAVADKVLAMPDGKPLPSVTISVGVAELQPGEQPPALLKAADRAMYQAKHGGRNRVITTAER
ncbi:MAG: diguanylate cyclase [Deltaproteobacteria bacterium]|nr:diguanylate cyclase [Deltaproteobacteria bacterium]